jgi:hypothetical protein
VRCDSLLRLADPSSLSVRILRLDDFERLDAERLGELLCSFLLDERRDAARARLLELQSNFANVVLRLSRRRSMHSAVLSCQRAHRLCLTSFRFQCFLYHSLSFFSDKNRSTLVVFCVEMTFFTAIEVILPLLQQMALVLGISSGIGLFICFGNWGPLQRTPIGWLHRAASSCVITVGYGLNALRTFCFVSPMVSCGYI